MTKSIMPSSANFTPNTSCAPCIYCGEKKDGKPDEFLRCDMCKQSAHLNCLKSGKPQNRLMGDNFFAFTCLYCSLNNEENVVRVNISILHAMLIAMYNLHISHREKATEGYFHYKKDIHSYMVDHWQELFAYEGKKLSFKDKTKMPPSCISGQLSQAPYFKAKKTGRGGWYRLVSLKCPAALIENFGTKRKASSDGGKEDKRFKHNDWGVKSSKLMNGGQIKLELSEESALDSFDDNSSRGSWFTDRSLITPMQNVPFNILEDDDEDYMAKPDVSKLDFRNLSSRLNGSSEHRPPKAPVSLFPSFDPPSDSPEITSYCTKITSEKLPVTRMNKYEELKLLNYLDHLQSSSSLSPKQYRLRRKLKVRQEKREHGLPVFNVDEEVEFIEKNKRLMTESERLSVQSREDYSSASNICGASNILDRFQISSYLDNRIEVDQSSFRTKLVGRSHQDLDFIHSPYSMKTLKPFIFRDKVIRPPKMKLLQEIVAYPHRKTPHWRPPCRPPIDYCYVTHKHIPAMNSLARQFFWPGIELSEVLRYPEFTCVVLFGQLVIGFGIVVPDTKHNEAYISFLLVHPEWRRAGIAKFMLYHLLQTCSGKDVTLHVSASNPASIMYQQFGFKVEEFLVNFYDKYYPENSFDCKHAMFLRLNR